MTALLQNGPGQAAAVIITRAQARDLGLKWYRTGVPCPKGHFGKRNVGNSECRACVDAKRAARRLADPDRVRLKDRIKYSRDPEKERRLTRANRAKHADKRRAYDRLRYAENPDRRARQFQQADAWWRLNRGKKNYMTSRQRAWVKQATPPWLTADQERDIRALYVEASRRPGEWHVDHVYPLRGPTSCGLNVPWNLQLLPGDENRRKRNTEPGGVPA